MLSFRFESIVLICMFLAACEARWWTRAQQRLREGNLETISFKPEAPAQDSGVGKRALWEPPVNRIAVALPSEFFKGVSRTGTWCAKASDAARKQCHLYTEDDRLQLATLIANCHLEHAGRPVVPWDPHLKLAKASEGELNLVFHVIGELTSICLQTGTAWEFALVTEQSIQFAKLEDQLDEILRAAQSLVAANQELHDAVAHINNIDKKVQDMQELIKGNIANVTRLSEEIALQLGGVEIVAKDARVSLNQSEHEMRGLIHKLTASVSSIPESTIRLASNTDRFEQLLLQQQRILQIRLSFLSWQTLAVGVLTMAAIAMKRVRTLLFCVLCLLSLKIAVHLEHSRVSSTSGSLMFPTAYSMVLSIVHGVLEYIYYPHFVFIVGLVKVWDISPSIIQHMFGAIPIPENVSERVILLERMTMEMARENDALTQKTRRQEREIGQMRWINCDIDPHVLGPTLPPHLARTAYILDDDGDAVSRQILATPVPVQTPKRTPKKGGAPRVRTARAKPCAEIQPGSNEAKPGEAENPAFGSAAQIFVRTVTNAAKAVEAGTPRRSQRKSVSRRE
jgi:hypothetical protein